MWYPKINSKINIFFVYILNNNNSAHRRKKIKKYKTKKIS